MAEPKTQPTTESVTKFLNAIADPVRRRDCKTLVKVMREATGKKPVMWGTSIVGFGQYHYKYQSGREGDWPVVAFSPRKQNISIYIVPGFERYAVLMKKLGRYKTGVSCLYVTALEEVHMDILTRLITQSVSDMAILYPCN